MAFRNEARSRCGWPMRCAVLDAAAGSSPKQFGPWLGPASDITPQTRLPTTVGSLVWGVMSLSACCLVGWTWKGIPYPSADQHLRYLRYSPNQAPSTRKETRRGTREGLRRRRTLPHQHMQPTPAARHARIKRVKEAIALIIHVVADLLGRRPRTARPVRAARARLRPRTRAIRVRHGARPHMALRALADPAITRLIHRHWFEHEPQ